MNQIATIARDPGDIMESVIVKGDLAKLSPGERAHYYAEVCRSVGLNPLTKPFEYITLNGKLTLYALRGATDQLRAIYKVSVEELTETERDGVYIVTAKVRNAEGRTDMAKGAVTLGNLKGDALANQIMKCETKAKRRATLSICGLGMLDETEIETIPGARKPAAASSVEIAAAEPEHDTETGEVGPRALAVPEAGGHRNWVAFGSAYIAGIQSAATEAEMLQWYDLNAAHLDEMAKAAPRAYGSVGKAIEKRHIELETVAAAPRLSPKDSQALRRSLVQKLARCETAAQVDEWRTSVAEGIASLQDEDQAGIREFEAQRREQLTEVSEVVGK